MMFWGGTTGNVWSDAAYAVCLANGMSAWMASTVDEIIVDVPDKLVTIIIVLGMYKSMPKSVRLHLKFVNLMRRRKKCS